jgi:hypothetical protein
MLRACSIIALLLSTLALAVLFGTVQAFTVDSISKPSVPEFSVRIVAYPYDVPPETTTTIDQYTGKETTTTTPGYHVENKSIEIIIKNPSFTPYNLTIDTRYDHETGESYTYYLTTTVNLYYNIEVKGNFGNDWTSVEIPPFSGDEGRKSNAQLDSEYTVITIEADDYPEDAVLDFRVQTLIGYYLPYGRNAVTFGYDFYGQESDWNDTQTITIIESQASTPTPETTPFSTPYTGVGLTETEIIIGAAIVMAIIIVGLGLLLYLIKRK